MAAAHWQSSRPRLSGDRAAALIAVVVMVAFACTAACSVAVADVIEYTDFTSTDGLTLNGDATVDGTVLRLVPDQPLQAGSTYSVVPLDVRRDFEVYARMHISKELCDDEVCGAPADGLTFVFHAASSRSRALGDGGGGLGYSGVFPSVAVENDIFGNPELGDPPGEHIGVDLDGSVTSIATASETISSSPIDEWILYDASEKTLAVYVAPMPTRRRPRAAVPRGHELDPKPPVPAEPALQVSLDLAGKFGDADVFAGLSAATGSSSSGSLNDLSARHDVLAWRLEFEAMPPETEIIASPGPVAERGEHVVSFTSPDEDVRFECRLDDDVFAACESPVAYRGLTDGPHAFEVRAVDRLGNPDPSPAQASWRVEGPPETVLRPPPAVSGPDVELEFSSPDADVDRFSCVLDGGAAELCASPKRYGGLAPGRHTFSVAAIDRAGNADPSPATAEWTVVVGLDCVGPAAMVGPDEDRDGIADRCDESDGTQPPIPGEQVQTRVLAGEVLFKPPRTARHASVSSREPIARSARKVLPAGFVPLKGRAVIPVGSIVDTTRGTLAVTAAVGTRRPRATVAATVRAGVFQIAQRRAARRAIPRLRLRPGSRKHRCPVRRPTKEVLGTLDVGTTKGAMRVAAAASAALGRRGARWLTRERCDGTLTRVVRASVAVEDRVRERTVTVRQGESYLARLQSFQTKARG